jgi:hypothetical protein
VRSELQAFALSAGRLGSYADWPGRPKIDFPTQRADERKHPSDGELNDYLFDAPKDLSIRRDELEESLLGKLQSEILKSWNRA